MELIKLAARRTKVSELVYILLNATYALLLLILLIEFEGQPYLAYLVVLLSKWRVFAVRPRFWLANMRTNLLDTLVGFSIVTLLWQNMGSFSYQCVVTILFAGWLIFLKPRSKHIWIIFQGAVAQFVALAALFSVAHMLHIMIVVALAWCVGFVVARHIVNAFTDEYEDFVIASVWGLVTAEIGWLTYFWTLGYTPYKIPQISLVMSLLGYAALRVYSQIYHHKDAKNTWAEVALPVLFSLAGIALLLMFFNKFDPIGL